MTNWGGLIATPVLGVVITLVFAATATHHNIDPFAKHLTPDQRDATITAFRAGILASIGLCIAGSVVAFVWLPKAGERTAEQADVGLPRRHGR